MHLNCLVRCFKNSTNLLFPIYFFRFFFFCNDIGLSVIIYGDTTICSSRIKHGHLKQVAHPATVQAVLICFSYNNRLPSEKRGDTVRRLSQRCSPASNPTATHSGHSANTYQVFLSPCKAEDNSGNQAEHLETTEEILPESSFGTLVSGRAAAVCLLFFSLC